MQIRPANIEDLQQILDIYNYAITHTTAVYDYEPHTPEMRKQWFAAKQKDGYPVLVAEEDGVIKGFCALGSFRAWAAYKFTVENAIYVKEIEQGKGIGKLMMRALIEQAKQLGYHTIVAGIDADNLPSIRLHERFGFKEVANFKEVGWKFDRWLNLKFMQLVLRGEAKESGDTEFDDV
ncbi:MAG: N-acetyltransferase [Bacteroidetes bacterium]|nr:N-acetyltransferase [Bacteroidota bacterium]